MTGQRAARVLAKRSVDAALLILAVLPVLNLVLFVAYGLYARWLLGFWPRAQADNLYGPVADWFKWATPQSLFLAFGTIPLWIGLMIYLTTGNRGTNIGPRRTRLFNACCLIWSLAWAITVVLAITDPTHFWEWILD